jgi:hypothetical protein
VGVLDEAPRKRVLADLSPKVNIASVFGEWEFAFVTAPPML